MESSFKFSRVLRSSEIQNENNLQLNHFFCKTAKHFMLNLFVSNDLNKIQNFQKEGPG